MLMRAAAVGVGAANITALLLTHLHSDHITDLSDVITTRWVTTFTRTPLPVIGPPGTAAVVEATLAALAPDISYRIAHHPDITEPPAIEVHEYTDGPVWDDKASEATGTRQGGVTIRVAPTSHRPVEPTIGFRVEFERASVVLAGDTIPCDSLDVLAAGAGALVHTVIRKDLVEQMPVQRIRDILDYHSSVEQAAATAERAGWESWCSPTTSPLWRRARRTSGVPGPQRNSAARSSSATICTGSTSTRAYARRHQAKRVISTTTSRSVDPSPE